MNAKSIVIYSSKLIKIHKSVVTYIASKLPIYVSGRSLTINKQNSDDIKGIDLCV